jgi:hypothetical protein
MEEAMTFGRRQWRQSLPLGDPTRLQAIEGPCSAIESGRYGDLIAVTGDPLKDMSVLEHVDFAMNGGESRKPTGEYPKTPNRNQGPEKA